MTLRALAVATLWSGLLAAAQAGTQVQTFTLAERATDWSSLLALQQFNPSLGQLNSVTVELTGTQSGQGGIENTQLKQGNSFTVRLLGHLSFEMPGLGSLLTWDAALVNEAVDLGKHDLAIDYAGTSGAAWSATVRDGVSRSFNDALHLAAFTGVGVVSAPVSAWAESVIDGPSNRRASFDTTAAGQLVVRYDYLAAPAGMVPEPGTWALMAGGLAVVGLRAVRRRKA